MEARNASPLSPLMISRQASLKNNATYTIFILLRLYQHSACIMIVLPKGACIVLVCTHVYHSVSAPLYCILPLARVHNGHTLQTCHFMRKNVQLEQDVCITLLTIKWEVVHLHHEWVIHRSSQFLKDFFHKRNTVRCKSWSHWDSVIIVLLSHIFSSLRPCPNFYNV